MSNHHVGKKLYSFDIFDTCVSRYVHKPVDIILELSIRTYKNSNQSFCEDDIRELSRRRILAENKARSRTKKEDITLADIYREISSSPSSGINYSRMLELEIEIELANAFPMPSILNLYNKLLGENSRVIFISDMYLPTAVITKILNNCGYNASEKEVYASGEIGLTKRSGRLFDYVLSHESVHENQVIHYGDNSHSDFHVPRKLGINAVLIRDAHTHSRYEQQLTNIHSRPYKMVAWVNRQSKLFRTILSYKETNCSVETELAVSRMAALMKVTRLYADAQSSRGAPTTSISSGVATPLIISFVLWVLTEAKRRGIIRLFFISRNGQIFYRVAKQLNKHLNYGIEFRYLYGSRSAWYPAAIYELDDYFFKILYDKYSGSTIPQILKEFIFSDNEISIIKNRTHTLNNFETETDINRIISFFKNIRDSKIEKLFTDRFSSNRRVVQQYLYQEGFTKKDTVGIVDVGWHLSSHLALHRILNSRNEFGFTGFYLGVDKIHETVPEISPYLSFFDNCKTNRNNWLFKLGAMTLLEDVFTAGNHGSVCGYQEENGKIQPILSESNYNYTATSEKIQNDVIYAAEKASHIAFSQDLSNISEKVINLYYMFYKYPELEEVKSIAESSIFARVDQEVGKDRTLARPLSKTELVNIIKRTLFHKKDISPDWMWFEGSAAMSEWSVRILGQILSKCNQLIERLEK